MLFINFHRQTRRAVAHQEGCFEGHDHLYGMKGGRAGYWVGAADREVAGAIAKDLKSTIHYATCCHGEKETRPITSRAWERPAGWATRPATGGGSFAAWLRRLGYTVEEPEHNLEDFEIIRGEPGTWGLRLWSESRADHTWWVLDQDLAKLHWRIHSQLNLDNRSLDDMGDINPPSQYQ